MTTARISSRTSSLHEPVRNAPYGWEPLRWLSRSSGFDPLPPAAHPDQANANDSDSCMRQSAGNCCNWFCRAHDDISSLFFPLKCVTIHSAFSIPLALHPALLTLSMDEQKKGGFPFEHPPHTLFLLRMIGVPVSLVVTALFIVVIALFPLFRDTHHDITALLLRFRRLSNITIIL